jgi:hypothetical protein
MTWNFPWIIDGEQIQVLVRDRIDSSSERPQHMGLEVQVEVLAASVDDAIARAHGLASLHLTLISAVSRSPTGSPHPIVAYEITPSRQERGFRQWHAPLPLPVGKTPVPQVPFRSFFEMYVGITDPSVRYPILMSMQLHAAGLREIEPVLRFVLFWPALEALERSRRRRLSRSRKDRFWGLKALAELHGETAGLIDDAYELRNDLFHVRPGVDPGALPARAETLGDRLETLIAPALFDLLGLATDAADLPAMATSAHPVQLIFTASMSGEPSSWSADSHPFVELDFEVLLRSIEPDGSMRLTTPLAITPRNCEQMTPRFIEIRGPFGPNIGQLTLDETTVVGTSEQAPRE